MNDLHHPCELWAERISVAAAGCLSPAEEREVRRHIETCSDCRERFRQLTELCGALAEARLPAESAEAAMVERVMSAVASGESGRPLVRTRAEMIHPTLPTRSPDNWRWIMRSRVSRVAASVVFVLAITGVALWFHGGGATTALADFLKPIREAKTVKYKVTTEFAALSLQMKLLPEAMQRDLRKTTSEVMMLGATRKRTESVNPDKSKTIHIWDGGQGKSISLLPAEKRAEVFDDANKRREKTPNGGDPVAEWRSMLLDAHDRPDAKRESLGEKVIDGRQAVGFRISSPAAVFDVWGDPKTGLPARVEMTAAAVPDVKLTMSDFEFNVDMDESLFSVEPPAGYEVGSFFISTPVIDGSTTKEKDLIETLREYSRLSGGLFPTSIDQLSLTQLIYMEFTSDRMQKPGGKQELAETQAKLQPGLMFRVLLPPEADAHYAGKGVSLGAADTPIFWYRPKDSEKYRVIYADLSVCDADAPPGVRIVQPEKELIEMFREYSELSGGPFPNALDMVSVLQMVFVKRQLAFMKKSSPTAPEEPQEPSVAQEQEATEAQAKLQRGLVNSQVKIQGGLKFAVSLPPEADSHYAGKGVSLGAVDTPIFWYRPKDSEKYRVIYADLSVRDADTPPSVPVAQPEQDLIEVLRYYSELSGGSFPNSLDKESLPLHVSMELLRKFPPEDGQNPSAKHLQEVMKFQIDLQPGLDFVVSLPPEADACYAGRGVSFGAADTPIFWYRPKDAKTYRVIYADLSVRDAETPPSAPVARPEEDLIDTFRHYSELCGGPFPDSLGKDESGLWPLLQKRFSLEKGQKPNAKQTRGITEISLKLLPGELFINKLPPEADAHYAGKGVSLGAADTPIFWYRPKDAKTYRITYADLSVREAETPPSVPDAQPVPAPSSPKK